MARAYLASLRFCFVLSLILFAGRLATAAQPPGRGTGKIYKVDYPSSSVPGELPIAVTFTLWVPDGAQTLRAVIVHQHGAGTTASIEGSTAAYDLHWQELARKWDCALFCSSYHVTNENNDLNPGGSELWFHPSHGSEKTFLRALDDFAKKTGHGEISKVPWAFWGHSGGGIWSDIMSTTYPQRVICMWLRSGSAAGFRTHPEFIQPQVPAACYAIPIMLNPGVKEEKKYPKNPAGQEKGPWWGNVATFHEYRLHDALVGIAPDPRTEHECGDSRYLAIPYIDACLAARLPEKGYADQTLKPMDTSHAWLAPFMENEAVPAAQYKGDLKEAVWLPNEAIAKAWMEYVKTGAVGDTTPPPAPFDVKSSSNEGATEITWNANADLESGIGGFIILRDGQPLASLPEKPNGKFGRPLFQGMTYHDTPTQPLAQMRYSDRSAKAGEKHAYAIVTVNSVGLKSEPAGEAQAEAVQAAPPAAAAPVAGYVPFDGEKSAWHDGFDRYDFVMDGQTMEIKPFKAPANERFAVGAPTAGNRRCVVVVPKQPAPGNPWSWQGCYWDHQPQTEVELLRRGFHIAYVSADANLKPDKHWDAWYDYLTEKHGLSKKPAFIGMSRGGEYSFIWATTHLDKVSCIYADNPGGNDEVMRRLPDLARADVPIILVCGTIDPILSRFGLPIENIYQQFGGRVSMILKEGAGHHPHSLVDPTPMADFIEKSVRETTPPVPAFVGTNRVTRSNYYSIENSYEKVQRDGYYLIRRGPAFTDSYQRYDVAMGFAVPAMIIVPNKPAPGNPWVLRANFVDRGAAVDQALLAKGFHIVVGPVGFNNDGPLPAEWAKLYAYLTDHGFSKKPVMEGAGGSAGAVYAWAIDNPDKVSCIYAENPILRTGGVKTQPIDNLAPLAKAGFEILHVSGSLDPALDDQTRVAEKRYKDLGGRMTVIIQDGVGHFPAAPKDVKPAVDFILSHQDTKSADAGKYDFDAKISRQVLENYLDRSICMEGLLNGRGDLEDNIRMLKATGAKYIARSICLWGGEANLLKNFERAKEQVPKVHAADPRMVLEACIFEIVTRQVDQVPIPAWAFEALGMPVETRNFRYADMIYTEARRGRQWGGNGAVPDVSRPETQLWFYFLARSYIDLGFEAIHWGQMELMNKNDPHLDHYAKVFSLVREYAAAHARRHMLLSNAHVPSGGLVRDGQLLLDFHMFPMRVMEQPDTPQEAILKVGFSDGIYLRSKGGITPSGWSCEHLPYLVELDNYGSGPRPGEPRNGSIWVWGYDEITWFAHQPQEYRAKWLRYAWDWMAKTDANGHIEMPGSRTMRSPRDGKRWYFANKPTAAVPDGLGDEIAIGEIWANDKKTQ